MTDQDGAVAQLGERNVRNVEVRGSIPLSSTIALIFEDFIKIFRPLIKSQS